MKLALELSGQEAAMISECEGVFVVEPMRFLYPSQAKREARGPNYDQLPWCPKEYRDHYRSLRRKGLSAAKARPLIEEQINTDNRRRSQSVLVSSERPSGHRI